MSILSIGILPLLVGFLFSLVVTVVAIYLLLSLRVEQWMQEEREENRRRIDELRSQVLRVEQRLAQVQRRRRSDGGTTSRPASEEFDWKMHPGAP